MYYSRDAFPPDETRFDEPLARDPRVAMAERLPRIVQPLLTWITAKPAPGEAAAPKSPLAYVGEAFGLVIGGVIASGAAMLVLEGRMPGSSPGAAIWMLAAMLLVAGLLETTSGLGLFQVVVFHHCAHGTVFKTRERNRLVGRAVSALLLFKHYELYQREHMIHHNANKLFTDDDEFTDFVVGICDLAPSSSRETLWRKLLILLVSPVFHARFLIKRVRGGLFSFDRVHNWAGRGFWGALLVAALLTHTLSVLLVAWVIPVTVLLQVATVFRILCEHRFPPIEVIEGRGKRLVCEATAGVFPGVCPPAIRASTWRGRLAWAGWWADMLTVQLFVRVFVLVGDAPCHDFHHRRPANKRWTDYTHARQDDVEAGCPGYPVNYVDTWGLFRALDQNFAAMARVPADLLG